MPANVPPMKMAVRSVRAESSKYKIHRNASKNMVDMPNRKGRQFFLAALIILLRANLCLLMGVREE